MADAKAAAIDNEAELEEGAADASDQPKKKFAFKLPSMSMKMMIIVGAAALVVVGGGVGAYLFFSHKHDAAAEAEKTKPKPTTFVDLPEVLVNLSNPGGERTQYMKVKIVLELPDQKMVEQIQPIMPRVLDAFQTYLRELRPSDLDGSAGLYRLKEELTRRVNASIAPARINAVLFKEIIVQ
jgi:flagellar FliL protein